MNNEEMRKMWEEAANRNKRMEAKNNALEQHPNAPSESTKPHGHPPLGTAAEAARQARIKKQSELYAIRKHLRSAKPVPKTDEYQYRMGDMFDKIENGPKAAARKLQAEKDKPKTEETP